MNINIVKCDHCGRIIYSDTKEYEVEAQSTASGNDYIEMPGYYEEVDLCDDCWKDLRLYIERFVSGKENNVSEHSK